MSHENCTLLTTKNCTYLGKGPTRVLGTFPLLVGTPVLIRAPGRDPERTIITWPPWRGHDSSSDTVARCRTRPNSCAALPSHGGQGNLGRITGRVESSPLGPLRSDPFDTTWPRVVLWLEAELIRIAKALFDRPRREHSGILVSSNCRRWGVKSRTSAGSRAACRLILADPFDRDADQAVARDDDAIRSTARS